jgi:hypothetical protein
VFVIKVNSVATKAPVPEQIQKMQESQEQSRNVQNVLGQSFDALKKMANIKDNRSRFF